MQMRAGRVAGLADPTDRLALPDSAVAVADDLRHVRVVVDVPVVGVEVRDEPARALQGVVHASGLDGPGRSTRWREHVDPVMETAAARSVVVGVPRAVHRTPEVGDDGATV